MSLQSGYGGYSQIEEIERFARSTGWYGNLFQCARGVIALQTAHGPQ
jgi:hypothetical protein